MSNDGRDGTHEGMGEALAIYGGTPTLTEELPREWPGVYWFDEEEQQALLGVLQRSVGFNSDLEPVLREFFGCTWAGAINSGTGALFAAASALNFKPGMEVLIPGFCWIPDFACIVSRGAIPVLIEVGEDLSIDPVDLERKITPRTRALIVAHMCGAAANLGPILEVARRHDLRVIEDCAQANGATYFSRHVGMFGDIGAFSLQQTKHCTCFGGGFMISNSEELGKRAELARGPGLGGDLSRIMDVLAAPPDEEVMWGEGRLMDPLMHAMAAVQMRKLPKIIASMQQSQRRIKQSIGEIPGLRFRPVADPESDCGSFLITYWPDRDRAYQAAAALKAEGVPEHIYHLENYGTHLYYHMPMLTKRVGWIPASSWPWDAEENRTVQHSYERGALPRSDAIFAKGVVMAVPSVLTDAQCDKIAAAYRKVAHHLLGSP